MKVVQIESGNGVGFSVADSLSLLPFHCFLRVAVVQGRRGVRDEDCDVKTLKSITHMSLTHQSEFMWYVEQENGISELCTRRYGSASTKVAR